MATPSKTLAWTCSRHAAWDPHRVPELAATRTSTPTTVGHLEGLDLGCEDKPWSGGKSPVGISGMTLHSRVQSPTTMSCEVHGWVESPF